MAAERSTCAPRFVFPPATTSELPDDKADEVMKLVATLEDDDDVQNVYSNLA